MLCEDDVFIIPEEILRMDPEERKREMEKAYAEMKEHPVIYKKKPLKNGLKFYFTEEG